MNNNYLILGLVLFFGVLYYCFSPSSVTENFQNQAITSGQDDMNSINTLAQLARNLMSGGHTIPGNLAIEGTLRVTGATTLTNLNVTGTTSFANNTWIKSIDGRQKLYFSQNGTTYFGTGDNYAWRSKRDADGTDLMILNGDNGALTVNGGNGALSAGGLNIAKGTGSPDWTKIQFGDRTGWRIRYQQNDANPIMDIYDTGVVHIKNMQVTPIVFSLKCKWGSVSNFPYLRANIPNAPTNEQKTRVSLTMSSTNTDPREQWFFNGQFIMSVANNECLAIDKINNVYTVLTVPPTPGNISKCVMYTRGAPGNWCNHGWCIHHEVKLICPNNNEAIRARDNRNVDTHNQRAGEDTDWILE